MRHRIAGRRLSRTSEHRLTMRRNLAASLIEHETVSTTIEKAKEVKPFVEKLITLAKKGTLQSRRQAITLLGNRDVVDYEDRKAIKKGTVIGKLFSELGPRYLDRPGGYTRIIRLSLRRLGDNGQLVLLQLVGEDETRKKKESKTKTKRSRRKAQKAAKAEEVAAAKETAETEEAVQALGTAEAAEAEETEVAEQTERSIKSDEALEDKDTAEGDNRADEAGEKQ